MGISFLKEMVYVAVISFIRYNEMIHNGKTYPMQCEYEGRDGGIHGEIGDYIYEKYWQTKW